MHNMKRGLALLSILLLLLGVSPVHAQTPPQSALAVSPAIFEAVLEPGKPATKTVTVTNTANVPLPIKSSVKSFSVLEEVSEQDRALFDASAWFKVSEPDFILQPKQKRLVTVVITP